MFFGQVAQVVSFLHPQADDDFTDRMHYYYTSTFLMISAVRSAWSCAREYSTNAMSTLKQIGSKIATVLA